MLPVWVAEGLSAEESLLAAQTTQLPAPLDWSLPAHKFYTTGPARTFTLEGQLPLISFEHIDLELT